MNSLLIFFIAISVFTANTVWAVDNDKIKAFQNYVQSQFLNEVKHSTYEDQRLFNRKINDKAYINGISKEEIPEYLQQIRLDQKYKALIKSIFQEYVSRWFSNPNQDSLYDISDEAFYLGVSDSEMIAYLKEINVYEKYSQMKFQHDVASEIKGVVYAMDEFVDCSAVNEERRSYYLDKLKSQGPVLIKSLIPIYEQKEREATQSTLAEVKKDLLEMDNKLFQKKPSPYAKFHFPVVLNRTNELNIVSRKDAADLDEINTIARRVYKRIKCQNAKDAAACLARQDSHSTRELTRLVKDSAFSRTKCQETYRSRLAEVKKLTEPTTTAEVASKKPIEPVR